MKSNDLKVFIISKEADCVECGDHLDRHAWITLVDEGGVVP